MGKFICSGELDFTIDYNIAEGVYIFSRRNHEVLRLAASSSGNDSIAADKVLLADTYSVGIELDIYRELFD